MDLNVSPLQPPNFGPFIKSANEFELALAEGEGCLYVRWPLVPPGHFKRFMSEKEREEKRLSVDEKMTEERGREEE